MSELPQLQEFLDTTNSKAFILLQDGKIAIEWYFGSFTRDSIHYWASAGKTLTAFLVGIAQEQGYLSIQNPASDYLGMGWTDCSPAQEEDITVWHQLTMTSGLDDGVSNSDCTLDTCLQFLAPAGTRWAYHNAPYTLLDEVIAGATGVPLNTYLAANVSSQTGISGFYAMVDYNNVFLSKARSMARFGLLALNRGVWNGTPILGDTAYFRQMTETSQAINQSYGYLWWLNGKPSFMVPGVQFTFPGNLTPAAPAETISAIGKNAQLINVVPSQGLVFIRMGDSPGGGGAVPVDYNNALWERLNLVRCQIVSTPEPNIAAPLVVFPNPVDEMLNIRLGSYADESIQVVLRDILGRTVHSGAYPWAENLSINVLQLASGIYYLEMQSGQGVQIQKFIKR